MAFGPAWRKNEVTLTTDAVWQPVVCRAAVRLREDLLAAREATCGWRDEDLAYLLVEASLGRCLAKLSTTGIWSNANRIPSGILWHDVGELLECGWLQHRARFKPRGYAGDHEMIARIVMQQECDDPLGKLFDRYFLRQAAPVAVRGRTTLAAATLAECLMQKPKGPFSVVSVGAGPALDVRQGLWAAEALGKRVSVTLMDYDDEALLWATEMLSELNLGRRLTCERENLFRLAQRPVMASKLPNADVLLCTGMFDYVNDQAAVELLRLFWSRLNPGGVMLVGNFAPHNPTRAYMEWIANWYLTYRTADELEALAEQADVPVECRRIGAEWTGVDLFLIAERNV